MWLTAGINMKLNQVPLEFLWKHLQWENPIQEIGSIYVVEPHIRDEILHSFTILSRPRAGVIRNIATTTKIASCLFLVTGSWTMKSILICSHLFRGVGRG